MPISWVLREWPSYKFARFRIKIAVISINSMHNIIHFILSEDMELQIITTAQSVFRLPKIDKENFSTFRGPSSGELVWNRKRQYTLLTKALRLKRREVFFVYIRHLKNRLCCCYIKTLPARCNLVILDRYTQIMNVYMLKQDLPLAD